MKKGKSVTFRPWKEQEEWLNSQEDKSESIRIAIDVYRNLPQLIEERSELRSKGFKEQMKGLEEKLDLVLLRIENASIHGTLKPVTSSVDGNLEPSDRNQSAVKDGIDDQNQEVEDTMAYFADSLDFL